MKLNSFIDGHCVTLKAISSFAGTRHFKPYANTTVSKTPMNVASSFNFNSETSFLFDLFLLNFNQKLHHFTGFSAINNYRAQEVIDSIALRKLKYNEKELIKLPKYYKINVSFDSLIKTRRSRRRFTKAKLSLKELSTILFYAQGITDSAEINEDFFFMDRLSELLNKKEYCLNMRTYPSGGGLYPIELYFFSKGVKLLNDGIYLYIPEHHSIKLIKEIKIDFDELAALKGIDVQNTNLFFIYVYNKNYNSQKYGESGFVFSLIELGSISQNLHLSCSALGCGSCDIGGFYKEKIQKKIGLNDLYEHVVSTTVAGK